MADSNALALVEIDDAIWVVIQPRTRHKRISVVENHLNTVSIWTCVTGLNMIDKQESIFPFHMNIILSSLSLLVKPREPDPTCPPAIYTVYNFFCSFCESAAFCKSFIPRKFRPVWQRVCACKTIVSQNAKMAAIH